MVSTKALACMCFIAAQSIRSGELVDPIQGVEECDRWTCVRRPIKLSRGLNQRGSRWRYGCVFQQPIRLEPGDLIACGTSVGVCAMQDGETVEVGIAQIGALTNRFG